MVNIFLLLFRDTHFFNLLRPLALRFCKIERNHSASMNKYLKDNLILGDWLENLFGSITLTECTLLPSQLCLPSTFERSAEMQFCEEILHGVMGEGAVLYNARLKRAPSKRVLL